MLILGSRIIGASIMSLQTGTKLAIAKMPIIDPGNLKIVAYQVDGPLLTDKPSYLRMADVRELSVIGMIIDSSDEFIGKEDVIAINKLIDLGFDLIGINVIDDTKRKLGKVTDYSIDAGSFVIQQLRVRQKMLKSLNNTEILIHRSQILEISNTTIIVRSAISKVQQVSTTEKSVYVNPFRSSSPQTNSSETID